MGQKAKNAGKKKTNQTQKKKMCEEFTTKKNKKAILAGQGLFQVERLLGRPFDKFNLLIIKDEGQYFSSGDNFMKITSYINSANADYAEEYYMWIMRSMKNCMDKTFYACINIRDKPEVVKSGGVIRGILDTTFYFWTE